MNSSALKIINNSRVPWHFSIVQEAAGCTFSSGKQQHTGRRCAPLEKRKGGDKKREKEVRFL